MAPTLSRRSLWLNKIADEVARGLRQQIEAGTLAVGAKLPDRDVLAAQYVTTIGTVDRALDMLLEEGWIIGQVDGAFQVARDTAGETVFEVPENFGETKEDIIAVLELRMGVEVVSAALAAERRDEAALDALRHAMEGYEAAAESKAGVPNADYRFHCEIARLADSRYIVELLEYLGPLLIPRMRVAIGPADKGLKDTNLMASVAEHRAIFDAIAAGDGEQARTAMRAHIQRSIELIRGLQARN